MIVGLVAQRGNERATDLAATIADRLSGTACELRTDPETAAEIGRERHPVEEMDGCDLVVSIGGDGTFLFAARGAGATPILGVNLGEVGFLNTVPPEAAVETVAQVVEEYQEQGSIPHRQVPRVRLTGPETELSPALNEVVVQGQPRGHADGIEVEIRVDGSPYDRIEGDGVLVATPTGSTAYNLSEGGPIVHPGVSGFVVTTMAARDAMPPLLVPEDATIELSVSGASDAVASSDGSQHRAVELPTTLTVTEAAPARVAGPGSAFFEALGKLE
jgi:NAD+ kinase